MYCMEIENKNNEILVVLHFLNLMKTYDFIRKFNNTYWSWDNNWQNIHVYSITNNEYDEGILEEHDQFTISREAFEELKKY